MPNTFRSRRRCFRVIVNSTAFCTLILMSLSLLMSAHAQTAGQDAYAAQASNPDGSQIQSVPASATATAGGTATSTAGATATASGTATSGATSARAIMQHAPSGAVHMTYDTSNKTLALNANLSGFAPKSVHPVQVEQGTCKTSAQASGTPGASASATTSTATSTSTSSTATPTGTASATASGTPTAPPAALHSATLTADDTGHITGSTTIQNVNTQPPASGLRVSIYNGPDLKTTEGQVAIACGNIRAGNGNQNGQNNNGQSNANSIPFIANLGPTGSPNEHASGTAQLTLENNVLTVKMNLRNLEPNSSHAAHLHEGTCKNIGAIKYDMGTITADGQGNASVTKTFNDVTQIPNNGLAAQVHNGTDLGKQDQYDPIMCGNVHTSQSQATPTSTP